MRTIALIKALPAITLLGLTGCTTTNLEEMTQLDAEAARAVMLGKTHTINTDYGKWSEYTQPDQLTGVGRGSGSWGAEKASSTHTISDSGEVCTEYLGEYKWSTDQHQYCALYFEDAEGTIYSKATKNTHKPERVGKVAKVKVSDGDTYNLMN